MERKKMSQIKIFPDGRMDAENAALYTGFSAKHLANLRYQGKGPRFVKPTNGKVFYYQADLDAWLNQSNCQRFRLNKTNG